MIKIKFNNTEKLYEVSFKRISNNVVSLGGDIPSNTSGFLTYRMDGTTQLGDFSDYTTIYRTLDDGVQFSNDGSTWIEPEPVPPIPPEPVPVEPTWQDKMEAQVMYTALITDTLIEEDM